MELWFWVCLAAESKLSRKISFSRMEPVEQPRLEPERQVLKPACPERAVSCPVVESTERDDAGTSADDISLKSLFPSAAPAA